MLTRVLVLVCILLATAALQTWLTSAGGSRAVPLRMPLAELPWQVPGFDGRPAPDLDPAVVAELGVDEYANRLYRGSDDVMVGLYVGYYARQRHGRTIHSPLNCLPGAGWEPVSMGRLALDVPRRARAIEINRYVVRKGLERLLILYWYQGRGRVTATEYWMKAFLVADSVRAGRTDGALVRVVSPLSDVDQRDEPGAERRAIEFVRAIFPVLSRHLPA